MKAALYARVSTDDQGTEMQLRELRAYAKRAQWEPIEYVDNGFSGAKTSRPALDKLLAAARKRKFSAVAVWRYDRFARSLSQLVNALDEFRALDIKFVSLQEGVDTATANGRLIFGVMATLAEFERELIRERIRSGMANAKERLKESGSYTRIRDGKPVKITHIGRPRKSFPIDKARALLKGGLSLRHVARTLKVSPSTLKARL